MNTDFPDWKLYELFVARLIVDQLSTDLCVTPNAHIKGCISGRSRQVDVLIDARHDTDNSQRIIIDAKKVARKIDVVHVEAFKGLMEDVGARHGYLICPVGFTAAAERRAQELISIKLLPFEELKDFDPSKWDRCQRKDCKKGVVFWDGFVEMSLTLAPSEAGANLFVPYIYHVGKCDRCGRFHVKCVTCQELFSLKNYAGDHRCSCKPPWFWLASVETDEKGRKSAELHVVRFTGQVNTVDRRPF